MGEPIVCDVEGTGRGSYRTFINTMRDRCRDPTRSSHNRPVLPAETNSPIQWIEVVLRTRTEQITLRIRRDNLYVVAYRRGDNQPWLELRRDDASSPQLIPGSQPLNFEGGYLALERAAHVNLENTYIGPHELVSAVDTLATTPNDNPRAGELRSRQLTVIILMVSESTRFENITTFILGIKTQQKTPTWMRTLIRAWEYLSDLLLHADAHVELYFRISEPNDLNIKTAEEASKVLGILKRIEIEHDRVRVPRMIDEYCRHGRQLVEVFSVWINGDDVVELYGTIKVIDGLGSQYIYNRERDGYESIQSHRQPLLVGPIRCLSGYDSFRIDVDLKDRKKHSPTDELCHEQFEWNVFNIAKQYDTLLETVIVGGSGLVTVSYIVMSMAVQATLEVTLVNGGRDDLIKVYGLLRVAVDEDLEIELIDGDGKVPADDYETESGSSITNWVTLFRKERGEAIGLRHDQVIPLSKSVVAVQLDSSLKVFLDLTDREHTSSDGKIAEEILEFPAQTYGTSEKMISNDKIRVKVIWNADLLAREKPIHDELKKRSVT